MKTQTIFTLAGIALATALAPLTHGKLDPSRISADAKWMVYGDLVQFRNSEIGKNVISRLHLDEMVDESIPFSPSGAKILEVVSSITAYGDSFDPEYADMNGALLLEGTPEMRTIAEGMAVRFSLSEPDGFAEVQGLPFQAYEVDGDVIVGFPEEPIVLVSRSKKKLIEALNLYRGRGRSLARGEHALTDLLPQEDNYYIYAASLVPTRLLGAKGRSPQAQVLQLTEALSVNIGETRSLAVARATLQSEDEDLADKLMRIINGVTAVLSLAESTDKDLTAFIESLEVGRSERRVSLDMSFSTSRLVEMVEQNFRREKRHQERRWQNRRSMSDVESLEGELIASWVADERLGSDTISADNFEYFTSEPITLSTGGRLLVSSRRQSGEHARVDFVELIPVDGGAPTRFEAEFMRLRNYRIEPSLHASGGEVLRNEGRLGTAQLLFNGPSGSYRVKVCYVDEDDGKASFYLNYMPKNDAESVGGKLIASWVADERLGSDTVTADSFALFTSEPIALSPGERLLVSSKRHLGEHARIDYLELVPVAGGAAIRYEAEFMRLENYRIEDSLHASGGEMLISGGPPGSPHPRGGPLCSAQLLFDGMPGDYRVTVRYVDEEDGKATFFLSHSPVALEVPAPSLASEP